MSECARCWKQPKVQPVLLTEESVVKWILGQYVDKGCMHDVDASVSYDEFVSLLAEIPPEQRPRLGPLKLSFEVLVLTATLHMREPERGFPITVLGSYESTPYSLAGGVVHYRIERPWPVR